LPGNMRLANQTVTVINECGVSSNNEVYYAATHSARQPEIALNSLVGVGAMTKTKRSIGGVVVSVLALCVVRMLPLKLAQSIL